VGHGAADSLTAMDITIHSSFLPHDDPDASLAFYRDTLGFEVRNDVGYEGMGWMTVGPADPAGTSTPEVKRLGLVRRTEVLRNG
jgi:catechol 2,3-dioxygenase-like lactoylglutathione lyase family enzyme